MFSKKFVHCFILAVAFFVVSSPMTYRLVDNLADKLVSLVSPHLAEKLRLAQAGCPTTLGLALHAVVFGVAAFYLLHP